MRASFSVNWINRSVDRSTGMVRNRRPCKCRLSRPEANRTGQTKSNGAFALGMIRLIQCDRGYEDDCDWWRPMKLVKHTPLTLTVHSSISCANRNRSIGGSIDQRSVHTTKPSNRSSRPATHPPLPQPRTRHHHNHTPHKAAAQWWPIRAQPPSSCCWREPRRDSWRPLQGLSL